MQPDRGQSNFTARMDRLYPNIENSHKLQLAKNLHDVLLPFACVMPTADRKSFKFLADHIAQLIFSMSNTQAREAIGDPGSTDKYKAQILESETSIDMEQMFAPLSNVHAVASDFDQVQAATDAELHDLAGYNKMIKGMQYVADNDDQSLINVTNDLDDLMIEQVDLLTSCERQHLGVEGKKARGFLPANFNPDTDDEDDYVNYDENIDIPDAIITLDHEGHIHLSCPECKEDDIYHLSDAVYRCFSCPHDTCRGFMNRQLSSVADIYDKDLLVMSDDYKEKLENQSWDGGFKRIE